MSANFFVIIPAFGTNTAAARVNSTLHPEKGVQFEIGSKGALINNKLFYEVSAFKTTYTNKMTAIAVKNPNDVSGVTLYSITANGGTQKHNGLEALIKYSVFQSTNKVLRSLRPFSNATYSDFEYKDFKFHQIVGTKDSVIDYSNRLVAGIPKFTANLGFDSVFKYGIYGIVTYAYRDKMSIVSTEEFYTSSY